MSSASCYRHMPLYFVVVVLFATNERFDCTILYVSEMGVMKEENVRNNNIVVNGDFLLVPNKIYFETDGDIFIFALCYGLHKTNGMVLLYRSLSYIQCLHIVIHCVKPFDSVDVQRQTRKRRLNVLLCVKVLKSILSRFTDENVN